MVIISISIVPESALDHSPRHSQTQGLPVRGSVAAACVATCVQQSVYELLSLENTSPSLYSYLHEANGLRDILLGDFGRHAHLGAGLRVADREAPSALHSCTSPDAPPHLRQADHALQLAGSCRDGLRTPPSQSAHIEIALPCGTAGEAKRDITRRMYLYQGANGLLRDLRIHCIFH